MNPQVLVFKLFHVPDSKLVHNNYSYTTVKRRYFYKHTMILLHVSAYITSLSFVNHFPEDGKCLSKRVEGVPCTYITGVFLFLCICWKRSCNPNFSWHWPI